MIFGRFEDASQPGQAHRQADAERQREKQNRGEPDPPEKEASSLSLPAAPAFSDLAPIVEDRVEENEPEHARHVGQEQAQDQDREGGAEYQGKMGDRAEKLLAGLAAGASRSREVATPAGELPGEKRHP